MYKPVTNTELFTRIFDQLKAEGKIPETLYLEYAEPAPIKEEILNHHFDVTFTLTYGNCEGVVLCPYLSGDSGNGNTLMELGIIKNLDRSDDTMRDMAVLGANFIIEATKYVNQHLDDFSWTGLNVCSYDSRGEYRGAYTCWSVEDAERTAQQCFRREHAASVVIRDNRTRKEKKVFPVPDNSQNNDK